MRARKVKALLAGGLVLGIGASATLASWTDTEQADASFTAGVFSTELSANGTQWSSTAQLTFNAANMYPGSVVYSPVFLRTTAASTLDGRVKLRARGITGADSGKISGNLTARASAKIIPAGSTASFTCSAAAFKAPAELVLTQQKLSEAQESATPQQLDRGGGSIAAYCIEVSLPLNTPSSAQGSTATHMWTWDAASIAPGQGD